LNHKHIRKSDNVNKILLNNQKMSEMQLDRAEAQASVPMIVLSQAARSWLSGRSSPKLPSAIRRQAATQE